MSAKKENKKAQVNFEDALSRLEGLVEKLESGNLSLAESLESFETGMTLAKHCEKELSNASGRIEKIMKDFSGSEKIIPMTSDEIDTTPDNYNDL